MPHVVLMLNKRQNQWIGNILGPCPIKTQIAKDQLLRTSHFPALKWPDPLFSWLQPHSSPVQSEEIWRLFQRPEKNILSCKSSTKCRSGRNLHLDLNFQEQIFAPGCWQGGVLWAVQELWWEPVDSMARKPTLLQAEHSFENMFLNVQQENKLKHGAKDNLPHNNTLNYRNTD